MRRHPDVARSSAAVAGRAWSTRVRIGGPVGTVRGGGGLGAPHPGLAGPDQVVGAVLGLDQGGVDRGREARIVELDRGVGPALLRGLLPGGAELDVGGAGDDPESGLLSLSFSTGTKRTLALRVRVLTVPARPLPFWVKVPMIAMMVSP